MPTFIAARQPAWRGPDAVQPASWAEARTAADLDWEPIVAPNFGYQGLTATDEVTTDPANAVTGDYKRDEDERRIIRSDTYAKLSVRNKVYQPIGHDEMGVVIDAVVGLGAKIDTAGSTLGGRWVWVAVYLDEPVQLPGDPSQTFPYAAFLNKHDGQGGFKALATSVRIICSNCFGPAEAQATKSGAVFTFRHSANWKTHVEEAKLALRGQREAFGKYVELATDLAKRQVTAEQAERFVVEFLPAPPRVTDRQMKNVEEGRQAIRAILAGDTTEGIRDTGFGLLQAAGEWLDHGRPIRSADMHYTRQLLTPEPLKVRATQLVKEIVGL